jgi:hypothetical protein
MIIVLAFETKIRGFKPGRGDGFLRAIKINSMPFFGGELKPSFPSRKVLQHVKITLKYEQRYFEGQIYHFFRQVPSDLLLDGCSGMIARELWWTNQEFSPIDIIPPQFSMVIYHLGGEK